jgi:hypothetical protein
MPVTPVSARYVVIRPYGRYAANSHSLLPYRKVRCPYELEVGDGTEGPFSQLGNPLLNGADGQHKFQQEKRFLRAQPAAEFVLKAAPILELGNRRKRDITWLKIRQNIPLFYHCSSALSVASFVEGSIKMLPIHVNQRGRRLPADAGEGFAHALVGADGRENRLRPTQGYFALRSSAS